MEMWKFWSAEELNKHAASSSNEARQTLRHLLIRPARLGRLECVEGLHSTLYSRKDIFCTRTGLVDVTALSAAARRLL